jgi:hypothetical protein
MLQDKIRQSDEYQSIAGTADEAADQAADVASDAATATTGTVVSMERGDIQFWISVATLVVLVLNYQEMRAIRMGGAA